MGSMQDCITNPYASLKQRTKPNKNLILVPFFPIFHTYICSFRPRDLVLGYLCLIKTMKTAV